jgi:hypothetical protein
VDCKARVIPLPPPPLSHDVGQLVKLPMREAINSPTYRKLERQDHDFDKLRIDPRVTALLKKIGLEE